MNQLNKRICYKMAEIVRKCSHSYNSDVSASCGHDLICGIADGDLEQRMEAWESMIKGNGDLDTVRNGIRVPSFIS